MFWAAAVTPASGHGFDIGQLGLGSVADLSAKALVTLVVIMILTGRLVWWREVRYWREAFFEEQRQKRELMITGEVARNVLRSLTDDQPPGEDEE